MNPNDAWLATLGQLQIQLHRATYETWVAGSTFVAFDGSTFTISVRNAYAKDWLEQRLYRLVQASLSTILREEVQVRFIVEAPAPPKPRAPLFDLIDEDDEFRPPAITPTPQTIHADPIEKPAYHFAGGAQFNMDYTLEMFVVGPNSELAFNAAEVVGGSGSRMYNPLFICGESGVGKTHLLQAIGHAGRAQCRNVLYVTAEDFTNDMIRAIRSNQMEAFRQHYREADLLIVDGVQFFVGKERTQEEFYHTFNALHNRNAQIVLAADRRPHQIDGLQDRLRSRFGWGVTAEMTAPNLDTRLAILQWKARDQDTELPLPVAELIASRVRKNVRDLEGALNQVLAQSSLTRQTLTREYAEMILGDFIAQEARHGKVRLGLEDLIEATATYYQLTFDDLLSKERSKPIATARHIATYLAREELDATLPEIGRTLGGRSHSTILNSYHKVEAMLASDPAFQQELQALRQYLRDAAS